jgi:ring-1,2-phenylacetyl-CoA epoxidase subunit PaaD
VSQAVTAAAVTVVRAAVAAVRDPELPGLTIEDLGILRSVEQRGEQTVVTITPTFSGCPALDVIRADVERALTAGGFSAVLETSLDPPWSSTWITPTGHAKLAAAGIAPPVGGSPSAPVGVAIGRLPTRPRCPRCSSSRTTMLSTYAATACLSLYRCNDCLEPFDAVKAI